MTAKPDIPTQTHKQFSPFTAATTFFIWVVATDRRFRKTQAMIDAPGIHF